MQPDPAAIPEMEKIYSKGGSSVFLQFFGQYLENFPVHSINFANPAGVQRHDRMVSLVERMPTLHQDLATAQTPTERTVLQRRIEATDPAIDRLAYEIIIHPPTLGLVDRQRSEKGQKSHLVLIQYRGPVLLHTSKTISARLGSFFLKPGQAR